MPGENICRKTKKNCQFVIFFIKNHKFYLRCEVRHRQIPVRRVTPRRERGKAWDEEVEAGKGDHVDRQLAEVSVQLAGEAEASCHAGHGVLKQM